MSQAVNSRYPVLVWILTILIGPLIFLLLIAFYESDLTGGLAVALLMIILGCLLSIPALTLYWLAFDYWIMDAKLSIGIKKIMSIITGLILIWLTFMIIGVNIFKSDMSEHIFPLAYSASLMIASFLVRISGKKHLEIN